MRLKLFVLICLCFTRPVFAQNEIDKGLAALNKDVLKGQLEFLASDWMEGRNTAEKGAYISADYIASMFQVYGIKPLGDSVIWYPNREERKKGKKSHWIQSYFQSVPMIEYSQGDDNKCSIIEQTNYGKRSIQLNYNSDFRISIPGYAVESSAPVVFVGYGYKDIANGYNDFKGIDVKGKIIIRLLGLPGHKDTLSLAYKKYIPNEKYWQRGIRIKKDKTATDMGVLAVIEVNPEKDNMIFWADNVPFNIKRSYYEGPRLNTPYKRLSIPNKTIVNGLIKINLSHRALNELLQGSDIDIKEYESKSASLESQKAKKLEKSLHIKNSINSRIIKARNVLGMIEGINTDEFIVIGAHYDHLGVKNGFVFNGADDNASGTVGVMSVAKAIMATGKKPEKTIIFAAWTGEEKGLLGSRYFVENPPFSINQIKYYHNLDMIGRDVNDDEGVKCYFTYSSEIEFIKALSEKHINQYKLNLLLDYKAKDKPRGGSDHSAFAAKNIPVSFMITGIHDDYHSPSDEKEKINYDKMLNIVKLCFLNFWQLANEPQRLKQIHGDS